MRPEIRLPALDSASEKPALKQAAFAPGTTEATRRDAALAESAGLNASATPRSRWLDGWLMRFAPVKARRARCINALAPGVLPLDEKLARAVQAYAEAGLPLMLRITPFTEAGGSGRAESLDGGEILDRALDERGWRAFDFTRVLLARIDDERLAAAAARRPAAVTLRPVGAEAFAEAVGALRGSPADQRAGQAERLRESPVPFRAALLERDGELLACAQTAREGDWVGLYDVVTAPQARNSGLATVLCATVLAEAASAGARRAYLQVGADNAPALAVYRRLGFADAYGYHYRSADPAAE